MMDEIERQYRNELSLMDKKAEGDLKLYAPTINESFNEQKAKVIEETNPEKDIIQLEFYLKGYEYDAKGNFKKVKEPVLSEYGINKIITTLRIAAMNTSRLGRIKEKFVRDATLRLIDDFTHDIGLLWREYGIKDETTKDLIISSLTVSLMNLISRSEEQNEKNWLGRISFFSESSNKNQGGEKKNIKDFFKL